MTTAEAGSSPLGLRRLDVLVARDFAIVTGAVFGLYALALIAFGIVQTNRFALSTDYSWYYQHYVQFGNGVWAPPVGPCANLLCGHFDLLLWPLSLPAFLTKAPFIFKLYQALAASSAQLVGVVWARDIVLRQPKLREGHARLIIFATIALAVLNPWIAQGCAFDYHDWAIGGLFVLLAGWSFYRRRRTLGYLFAALAIFDGDLAATYVAALGVGLIIGLPRSRRDGAVLFVASFVWLYVIVHVFKMGQGAHAGAPIGTLPEVYGYLGEQVRMGALGVLAAIVLHPDRVLHTLWLQRLNLYANLAPGGFFFLAYPPAALVWLAALLENLLSYGSPTQVSAPGFQYAGVYAFALPGFAWAAARVVHLTASGLALKTLAGLSVLNAAAWTAIWIPSLPDQWIRVTPAASVELRTIRDEIGREPIVASGGIVGGLSGRKDVAIYGWAVWTQVELTKPTVFVFAPLQGIEVPTVEQSDRSIAAVLADPSTRVLLSSNDVWAMRYFPKSASQTVSLLWEQPVPAIVFGTGVGFRHFAGDLRRSAMEVDGDNPRQGYLVERAYWRRPRGSYIVRLRMDSATPVRVEIQDHTNSSRIAANDFPTVHGSVNVPFELIYDSGPYAGVFRGAAMFKAAPEPRIPNDVVEVRVFVPAHARTRVYSVELAKYDQSLPFSTDVVKVDRE